MLTIERIHLRHLTSTNSSGSKRDLLAAYIKFKERGQEYSILLEEDGVPSSSAYTIYNLVLKALDSQYKIDFIAKKPNQSTNADEIYELRVVCDK